IDYLYHVWGLSVINPSLVDNFNVFLGGFPVEYDDVLGGVVDMQLRNPKTDRLHQTYRIAINESAALLEGPINERQSFYVAARASYLDKLLAPFIDDISSALNSGSSDTEVSIITLPRYWDAQANWHYRLPKGSMDLYYFGSNDGLVFDIKKLDTADPELLGKLDVDFGFHSLGFNVRSSLAQHVTGLVTTSIKRAHTWFSRGRDENGKPFGFNIEQTELLFHPQLIFSLPYSQELTVGGQAQYGYYPLDAYIGTVPSEENFRGRNFSSRKKYQIDDTLKWASASPYAKWRWTLGKFTTILGARYSKVRGTGGIDMEDYSPRSTVEYQANTKLLLTTSWGRYIQTPNPAQLVRGYGNPNLDFTIAEHRIAGLKYKVDDLWSVQMEAYHKPMRHLVLTQPTQDPPNIYKNIGEGEAYGIDLLIKRDYGNRKMGWLSYSFARSSRTLINGGERDFSGDQPHTLSMVWSQPFTGDWTKWSWGFKLQAGSGRPYTPVVGRVAMCDKNGTTDICPDQDQADDDPNLKYWNPIYAERNILRRPFYHQLDIRIDRLIRYNTWTLKVYLDVLNVTFQRLGVSDDYGKNYENYNHPKKSGFPPIPLPFLGIEASF
ncbi:MAG: TonB-dependent receptor, partial [Gammaproteobacteria bacterium]|nr:TonB-dependent receptor [Gammaproteobacteria bacterium]